MSIRLSVAVTAAVLTVSAIPSARAEMFNFSYTFGDGGVASGVIEGTIEADANTVDLTAVQSLVVLGENIGSPAIGNLPATATFDGSNLDLLASAGDTTGFFFANSAIEFAIAVAPSGAEDFETFDPNRWSLTEVLPSAIPEPTTWTMMLARVASLGYAAFRRRMKKRARGRPGRELLSGSEGSFSGTGDVRYLLST